MWTLTFWVLTMWRALIMWRIHDETCYTLQCERPHYEHVLPQHRRVSTCIRGDIHVHTKTHSWWDVLHSSMLRRDMSHSFLLARECSTRLIDVETCQTHSTRHMLTMWLIHVDSCYTRWCWDVSHSFNLTRLHDVTRSCDLLQNMSHSSTGWRRLIGCLKLQAISRKSNTNHKALLWEMTYVTRSCDLLQNTSHSSTLRCGTLFHLGTR